MQQAEREGARDALDRGWRRRGEAACVTGWEPAGQCDGRSGVRRGAVAEKPETSEELERVGSIQGFQAPHFEDHWIRVTRPFAEGRQIRICCGVLGKTEELGVGSEDKNEKAMQKIFWKYSGQSLASKLLWHMGESRGVWQQRF